MRVRWDAAENFRRIWKWEGLTMIPRCSSNIVVAIISIADSFFL